jgi:branched-chain amino acid transport system substrate-binding protein
LLSRHQGSLSARVQKKNQLEEEFMKTKKSEVRRIQGLSRRELIIKAGVGGIALAAGGRGVYAADAEKVLKVGFISPRSGALAGFGQGDGYVLEMARKSLANGFAIGGTTYKVQIIDQDTQSNPSRAGQLANTLINNDKVDLMLATSTPEVVNPVADACEAAGVPSLSTVMPWEAFYFGRGGKPGQPSPFKWSFSVQFRNRRIRQDLSLDVGLDEDQQEGRRPLSQ